MVHVQQIQTNDKSALKAFIDFPHELYKNDPNYVPELFIAQRDLLTKHPFLIHSEIALFLAYDEKGKVVGRIAGILNNNHNNINQVKDGFFGFFDTVNDVNVAQGLFDAAEKWLKTKKVNKIIGPANPSTNETCGLLIEGYDSPPVAMMTYNAPYYKDLIEQCHYKKMTDLLAWNIEAEDFDDKPFRLLEALNKRLESKGITIRNVDIKNFKEEIKNLLKVYNSAWDKNLGFVPMTDEEFKYLAKDLKLILDTDFCLLAEHEGQVIGFALCIPDINQILIKIKKGRLFPLGIFKLLWNKRKINAMRVIALGVTEHYRKMGIEAVFYGKIIQKGREKGYKRAEASWILEDNTMMNRALENINAKAYKKYRFFEKELEA